MVVIHGSSVALLLPSVISRKLCGLFAYRDRAISALWVSFGSGEYRLTASAKHHRKLAPVLKPRAWKLHACLSPLPPSTSRTCLPVSLGCLHCKVVKCLCEWAMNKRPMTPGKLSCPWHRYMWCLLSRLSPIKSRVWTWPYGRWVARSVKFCIVYFCTCVSWCSFWSLQVVYPVWSAGVNASDLLGYWRQQFEVLGILFFFLFSFYILLSCNKYMSSSSRCLLFCSCIS